MSLDLGSAVRLLPDRNFPRYAYLPGRYPHPVRDPRGHSYQAEEPPMTVSIEAALTSPAYRWGVDLFNHAYYWEAHEAWEPLWLSAKQSTSHLLFFKGLILLAAAGVKIREGKPVPARRHAGRAASLFRQVASRRHQDFDSAIGMSLLALAEGAETAVGSIAAAGTATSAAPKAVFGFRLMPESGDT